MKDAGTLRVRECQSPRSFWGQRSRLEYDELRSCSDFTLLERLFAAESCAVSSARSVYKQLHEVHVAVLGFG
jgi:hypothetical protein